MELVRDASETYTVWMAAIDKRVVSWPLMANPLPTLAICLAYCISAFALPRILKGQVGITDIYRMTRPWWSCTLVRVSYTVFHPLVLEF